MLRRNTQYTLKTWRKRDLSVEALRERAAFLLAGYPGPLRPYYIGKLPFSRRAPGRAQIGARSGRPVGRLRLLLVFGTDLFVKNDAEFGFSLSLNLR